MKITKRMFAVLLALVMVVTTVPMTAITAFADEPITSTDGTYTVKSEAAKWVYNNPIRTIKKTPDSAQMQALDTAMYNYEQKMSGTVYTNMFDAYEMYTTAFKLYNSAIVEGNADDEGIETVANKLQAQIDAMTPYTVTYYADKCTDKAADGSYKKSDLVAGDEMSNVIYTYGVGSTSKYKTETTDSGSIFNKHKCTAGVQYGDIVFIYDGVTDMACPINAIEYTAGGGEICRYIALDSAGAFELKHGWHGYSSKNPKYSNENNKQNLNYTVSSDSANYFDKTTENETHYFSNTIYLNKNSVASQFTQSNGLLYSYTPTYQFQDNSNQSKTGINSGAVIYAINFVKYVDEIASLKEGREFHVYDYKWGGLAKLFKAVQTAIEIDPTDFNYGNDAQAGVDALVTEMESRINAIANAEVPTTDAQVPINPTSDINSNGDAIHIDGGVIYTHLANDSYGLYGQEISDNTHYGEAGYTAERVTKITTTYPNFIDTANPVAAYCLSDEQRAIDGYTFGDIRVKPMHNDNWIDDDGNVIDEVNAYTEANGGKNVFKEYYFMGDVSDYFGYHDGEYTKSGVELVVSYKASHPVTYVNGIKTIGAEFPEGAKDFAEYEFAFVTPNPVPAHTFVGLRDQYSGSLGQADRRNGCTFFARAIGSYGTATNIKSEITSQNINCGSVKATISDTGADGSSSAVAATGNFKFATSFGSEESLAFDYSSPAKCEDAFDFFEPSQGYDAGAYSIIEYTSQGSGNNQYAYTNAANVVDADYYIDYSDPDNDNITRDANDKPTGYQFDMLVSNIQWATVSTNDRIKGVSVDKNSTGLSTSYSSVNTGDAGTVGGSDQYDNDAWSTLNYNRNNYASDNRITDLMSTNGELNHVFGYRGDRADQLTDAEKTVNPLPIIRNEGKTGKWLGDITFNGKDSLHKNTDTSSAETYANYIYAVGTNGAVGGWTDTFYFPKVTYHYYNIGVNTCDKGAVRSFVNKYANRKMVLNKNEDDVITSFHLTDDHASIAYDQYSVSSIRTYLDALAEAYWFIENPYNTTYTDDNGIEQEYTTAYGPVNQLGGGRYAIMFNNYSDEEKAQYVDIFEENQGNIATDPVQCQIVQDILSAYNKLFTKNDYSYGTSKFLEVMEMYGADTEVVTDKNGVPKVITYIDEDGQEKVMTYIDEDGQEKEVELRRLKTDDDGNFVFLPDSTYEVMSKGNKESFDKLMALAVDAYGYGTNQNDLEENQEYWRYVKLDGVDYSHIEEILDTLADIKEDLKFAMPAVDQTELIETVGEKEQVLAANNGASATPATYKSWKELSDAVDDANDVLDETFGDDKYKEGNVRTITVDSEPFTITTMPIKQNEGESDADYEARLEEYYSDSQKAIGTSSDELAPKNVVSIDEPEAYDSFNDAKTVVKSLDTDKYTDEGVAHLNEEYDKLYNDVYTTLTGDDAAAFGVANGTEVKNTTLQETDPITASLLELNTEINNTDNGYVKSFNAYFTVQDDKAEPTTLGSRTLPKKAWYGETFSFSADEFGTAIDEDTAIKWSVTILNKAGEPTNSFKWRYDSTTIDRIADADVAVTATVTKEAANDSATKIEVYDVYNRLITVAYSNEDVTTDGNDLRVGSDTLCTAEVVPFYNFNSWSIGAKKDGVIKVKSIYTVNDNYTLSAVDGTFTGKVTDVNETTVTADFDTKVTVTYDGDNVADFYGWAIEKNGKYQIASYSKAYSFYTVADENFVPIIKTDDGYTVNGEKLKTENLDSTLTIKDTDALNNKLNKQYPFVAIEGYEFTDSATKMVTYVRITEGSSEEPTAFGIKYAVGEHSDLTKLTKKFAANNKLATGQLMITLRSSNSITNKVSVAAYMTYDYEYSFDGQIKTDEHADTSINTVDYSSIVVENPNA